MVVDAKDAIEPLLLRPRLAACWDCFRAFASALAARCAANPSCLRILAASFSAAACACLFELEELLQFLMDWFLDFDMVLA